MATPIFPAMKFLVILILAAEPIILPFNNALTCFEQGQAYIETIATYYEQNVIDPDENDDIALTHKWVVPSLTPGTTYKYWLGIKVLSTSGTPKINWGGASSQRFLDFIMKATALPSNTDIQ